jgi:GAF domain-containing protein
MEREKADPREGRLQRHRRKDRRHQRPDALMETFADQAAIAIENARLLSELQARTQELTRSVGQLTALGERTPWHATQRAAWEALRRSEGTR